MRSGAYSEMYLPDAMRNMGELTEYVADACKEDPAAFFAFFLTSEYPERWEGGDPHVICGRSGTELHHDVMRKCGVVKDWPLPITNYHPGRHYWCGETLALLQWKTGMTFRRIFEQISYRQLRNLYSPLHTASEGKILDTLRLEMEQDETRTTRLQAYRKAINITQRELSERSGVNLRTLQQYEVRDKDLSKASADKVLALANALSCRIEELIE